jgi:hypothetical protein
MAEAAMHIFTTSEDVVTGRVGENANAMAVMVTRVLH